MTKKSKKIKPTSIEERIKIDDEIFSKVSKEKLMKIPNEDVVLVPISGMFKHHLDDIIHFLMDDMEAQEIIKTMQMIRINFKDVKSEQIDIRTKCIWALMTLTSEINYQAAAQDKLKETDITIGDSIDNLMQSDLNDPPSPSEVFKDKDVLKKFEEHKKNVVKLKQEEEKKIKKKKDSTEGSPQ